MSKPPQLFEFAITDEEAKEITLACISRLPISIEQKIITDRYDVNNTWFSEPDPLRKPAAFMLTVGSYNEYDRKVSKSYHVLRYSKGYTILGPPKSGSTKLLIVSNLSLDDIAQRYLHIPYLASYRVSWGIDLFGPNILYEVDIFDNADHKLPIREEKLDINNKRLNTYAGTQDLVYGRYYPAKAAKRTLAFSVPLLDINNPESKHGVEERWFVSAEDWTKLPKSVQDVRPLTERYWLFGQLVGHDEYIQYIIEQGNTEDILLPELLEISARYVT